MGPSVSASLAAESISETGRTVHEPRARAELIRICTGAPGEPNSAKSPNFDWSDHSSNGRTLQQTTKHKRPEANTDDFYITMCRDLVMACRIESNGQLPR